jgi:hypothetical protein
MYDSHMSPILTTAKTSEILLVPSSDSTSILSGTSSAVTPCHGIVITFVLMIGFAT